MSILLTIPARVNLLGNPGDGNEGDFAVLSAAVELRATARIRPADRIVLVQGDQRLVFPRSSLPLPIDGRQDLVKAAVNRLASSSPEFRDRLRERGFELETWSEVPRQSGLGGSSLYVLLTLAALRALYSLDRLTHHDYLLAELTQRIEELDLGIVCGYADRYVPLFGGLAYVDYRGKLAHAPLGKEPLATYERLDSLAADLPLVAVSTGVRHDSGNVHGRMRPRYLEEHARWKADGGQPPPMVRMMAAAWETAWRGKLAVLSGDLETFGTLMDRNHALVDEMMHLCGFTDGAGEVNNQFIRNARQQGALGAKLTGAGGGGSVFALTRPGEQARLLAAWHELAVEQGLKEAVAFPLTIARQGLTVQEEVD